MGEASVLQVVIFRDGNLVGSEVFVPGDYAVGSDPGCELVLADDIVGRCQAFLSFREGKVTLQNVAGDVDMTVNGAAQKQADVRALDDVAIGPYLLKFRVVAQKARPGAAAPASGRAVPTPARASPPPAAVPTPAPARASGAALQPVAPARPAPPAPVAAPRSAPRAVPVVPPAAAVAIATEKEIPISKPPAPEERTIPAIAIPRAPRAPEPIPPEFMGEPEGREPKGPSLRVRVFWGKAAVGVYGFAFGREVLAGPADSRDVPLYRLDLPGDRYVLARCDSKGWLARIPKAMRAYRFEPGGWRPAEGDPDGNAVKVRIEQGKLLRLGDATYSVEMRADRIKRARPVGVKDLIKSGAMVPVGLVGVLGILTALGIIFMPKYNKDSSDFNPQQMLRAAKAILKPPEKKEEKKKAEEKKPEEKKPAEKKVETQIDQVVPANKAQNVNRALKAVQKIVTAGPAVESLLKATSKLAGGPKGYGDKGMGYKLSPLIGKPPIAMAGMGFGQGMGGFGTETHGLGAIRGMGGGGGGGIGSFSAGGTGKGKVAGTVVSAPSSGFHQRAGGGTLARELIAKVINDHLGEVRGCYERALLKEAGLAGKLVLEWTIDLSGAVEEIKVKQATIKGSEVPNCIVGSLKTWVFPKPTGGKVVVSYPFLFNSVGF